MRSRKQVAESGIERGKDSKRRVDKSGRWRREKRHWTSEYHFIILLKMCMILTQTTSCELEGIGNDMIRIACSIG